MARKKQKKIVISAHLAGINFVRELAGGSTRRRKERRAVAVLVVVDERDGLVERVDFEANLTNKNIVTKIIKI
jgi:hypothetical protein